MMNFFQKINYLFSGKKSHFRNKIFFLTGFQPKRISYYIEAFTHTANSKNLDYSFERLEFLGDSILNTIVTDYIFKNKPKENEGNLTQLRSKIVRRTHLNDIGEKLDLTHYLVNFDNQNLGVNINGNLLESLVGAIYLDLGYTKCKQFVAKNILDQICLTELDNKITSYKSFLHEWCQKNKIQLEYNTVEEENAEDMTVFVCIIRLDEEVFVKGRATNKKQAEENASRRAYYSLQNTIEKHDEVS